MAQPPPTRGFGHDPHEGLAAPVPALPFAPAPSLPRRLVSLVWAFLAKAFVTALAAGFYFGVFALAVEFLRVLIRLRR